jgi:hypothetical protein
MELLLNLLWVLLIPPAFYWWFQQRFRSRSALSFVALVGALAFLFPVISATDDLRSVADLCEASPSKRNLKYFTGESGTTPQGNGGTSAASLISTVLFDYSPDVVGCALFGSPVQLQQVSLAISPGRAPPALLHA